MNFVKRFQDLEVYKLSRKLTKDIFELSKAFPKEEMYSLTDQIRRASRSIGSQIAEAWGKRRYQNHFISKLTDADSEQLETQPWIGTAFESKYLTHLQARELYEQCQIIGKKLNKMIEKAETFCIKPIARSSDNSKNSNVPT